MTFIKPFLQLVFYIVLGLSILACDKKEPTQTFAEVIRPVKTFKVEISKKTAEREFPGVVDAVQKADLSFRVSGKLKEILVDEGEMVKKGQLIAQIDKTDFQIKLKGYKADYNYAKANFERGSKLVDKGHISRSDFDKLKSQYRTSEANLASAQQNLNYTDLLAPFSGHIAKHHVENFEDVELKQAIVTIQDISSLLVKIDVSESVMIKFKGWGKDRVQYAMFDKIIDKKFPLTFKEVATLPDKESQTFQVVFSMPKPENHIILPGMTVRVLIGSAAVLLQNSKIYLPAHAIQEDDKGRFVYIAKAEKGKSEAIIHRTEVITSGEIMEQGIEISSGIKEGDQVVTAGMSKLSEGLRVRLINEEN